MVPRSLRWEVPPQKGDSDLEDWFKYFNLAGVSFLRFLVERKAIKLARLDEEIKTIKVKLDPFKEGDGYKEKYLNLLNLLEKEDKEQRNKKKKIFYRDLEDYQGNMVFNWQKKLLEEQCKQNSTEMEVSNSLGNNPGPSNQSQVPLGPRRNFSNIRSGGHQVKQSPRKGPGGPK